MTGMHFSKVCEVYEQLEAKSKRLEMGDILVGLITATPVEVLDKVLFLTQGKLMPDYNEVELGIADKVIIKTLSALKAVPESQLETKLWEVGDLGLLAQEISQTKQQKTIAFFSDADKERPLTVEEVYEEILRISQKKDKESQAQKMDIIKGLLQRANPVESKYIIRILTKNMRLGIKDMSILEVLAYINAPDFDKHAGNIKELLDILSGPSGEEAKGLSDAFELLSQRMPSGFNALESVLARAKKVIKKQEGEGTKSALESIPQIESELEAMREGVKETRTVIENSYNLTSDIGQLAVGLKKGGIGSLCEMRIRPGVPVRAMLAERLPSLQEIVERLGGKCALEYKYDGLRMQVHITPGKIRLYSRGLEDITGQFMDVCAAVKASFKGQSAIVDGECVPMDPVTHDMLPFQYISRRSRRKHDLASSKKTQTLDEFKDGGFEEKIPVALILFDCLSFEGEDVTERDYISRRETLSKAFSFDKDVRMSTQTIVGSASDAEEFFMKAVDSGCEGVVAKSVASDSVYKAGKRGFLWIKYKRDYRMELTDSLDLVIVGGFYGQGRRTGVYGALLMAAFNPETGNFETVCKLGTGFDDQALKDLHQRLSGSISKDPPDGVAYDQNLNPEIYFEPTVLLEVKGAEITYSPVHTCAKGQIKKGFGLALRFPRYTGRVRDDKTPEQATSAQEIINMFKAQTKKGQ